MKFKIIAAVLIALSLYSGLKYIESLRANNHLLKKEVALKQQDIKALNLAIDEINKEYQRLNEIMAYREYESNYLKFNIESIKKGVRDESEDGFIEFNLFDELNRMQGKQK